MNVLLFTSELYPGQIIEIIENDDGTYTIPLASVDPDANIFDTIEEIEQVLNDKLKLIRPKSELN